MLVHIQLDRLGTEQLSRRRSGHLIHHCCSLTGKLSSRTIREICGQSSEGRTKPIVDVVHQLVISQFVDFLGSSLLLHQAVQKSKEPQTRSIARPELTTASLDPSHPAVLEIELKPVTVLLPFLIDSKPAFASVTDYYCRTNRCSLATKPKLIADSRH